MKLDHFSKLRQFTLNTSNKKTLKKELGHHKVNKIQIQFKVTKPTGKSTGDGWTEYEIEITDPRVSKDLLKGTQILWSPMDELRIDQSNIKQRHHPVFLFCIKKITYTLRLCFICIDSVILPISALIFRIVVIFNTILSCVALILSVDSPVISNRVSFVSLSSLTLSNQV